MPTHRPHHGPRDHAEGPPSAQARADLAGELRREVADVRLRLEEASLRAEAHRLLGDDEGAAAAVGEQEIALADVEDRLARVVSAAVVQRDAEQVLADAARQAPPVVEPVAPAASADVPRRVPVLSGVATVVAVLVVAVAAVLGLTDANRVQITDAATGATEPPAPAGPADPPAGQARPALPADDAAAPGSPGGTFGPGGAIAADPNADAATDAAPTGADRPTDDPTGPAPTPETDFDEVVGQLVDAVAGLGDDDPPATDDSPSPDVDATVPDEELDGGVMPDDVGTAGDGFVPAPLGQ